MATGSGILDQEDWLRRQISISGDRLYGFEFKILQDQYPAMAGLTMLAFLEQCKAIGVTHYILLVRRNTLRHVISHYASKNRGAWHLQGQDKASPQRFTLDLESITTGSAPGRSLLAYLREVEEVHDMVRQKLGDQALLEVEYETDIDQKGADFAYQKICRFLRLKSEVVTIRNRRANPFPMSDTVLNYDAIVQMLTGTEFEWMLERWTRGGLTRQTVRIPDGSEIGFAIMWASGKKRNKSL